MSDDAWWVACLCAGWCGVCRDWRAPFEALARQQPGWRVAWVDVEDEDEAMGDLDIDTFPTVLVAHGATALFLGPVAPSAGALQRLVTGLQALPQPLQPFSAAAQALFARLLPEVLPRSAL
jgi:thioredoxin 1